MNVYRTIAVLALIGALPLAGCAAIHRSEAQDTHGLLAAAGFQAKPAATPEELTTLKTLPPRKLIVQTKAGHLVYTYADPDYCQCVYEGGAKEYAKLARRGHFAPHLLPQKGEAHP
jgi:hypothetical protein